jgi:hypothetical protein
MIVFVGRITRSAPSEAGTTPRTGGERFLHGETNLPIFPGNLDVQNQQKSGKQKRNHSFHGITSIMSVIDYQSCKGDRPNFYDFS